MHADNEFTIMLIIYSKETPMSPAKLKTPEQPSRKLQPTTTDKPDALIVFMEQANNLRIAKHNALLAQKEPQPTKLFVQPKKHQQREKNIDGTMFTKHKEYTKAIEENAVVKFNEIFTQAHATPEGGSYFYDPSYNSNELLMIAIQTEIQTKDSKRPYVDTLLQNRFVKEYLNANIENLIKVVVLLYIKTNASRTLKNKISSNINKGNIHYFDLLDLEISERSTIEKISVIKFSMVNTLMTEENQRGLILQRQKQELNLFIDEINSRLSINKLRVLHSTKLHLTFKEELKSLFNFIEQTNIQHVLNSIETSTSASVSQILNTPLLQVYKRPRWIKERNYGFTQQLAITDEEKTTESNNLTLTLLSLEANPLDMQVTVQDINYSQDQPLQTSIQDFLKITLLAKTDDYLHWRKNKNSCDNRDYSMGFFTRMRHFSVFGERRAQNFRNQLIELTNDKEIFALLKTHFNHHSRLNNHSLDTYLLEGLEKYQENSNKISRQQNCSELRSINSRENFRIKFC